MYQLTNVGEDDDDGLIRYIQNNNKDFFRLHTQIPKVSEIILIDAVSKILIGETIEYDIFIKKIIPDGSYFAQTKVLSNPNDPAVPAVSGV